MFSLNCTKLFLSLYGKTMPPKITIESFFTASSKRSCQHIENEPAADVGEVEGRRGGSDKNVMSNFIFSPLAPTTFKFAPAPLHKL